MSDTPLQEGEREPFIDDDPLPPVYPLWRACPIDDICGGYYIVSVDEKAPVEWLGEHLAAQHADALKSLASRAD